MADVLCRVCGEPWDAWGANHGDMKWWEYDLFRAGKGCPSCEGVRPEGADPDELDERRYRRLLMNGPDDPDAFGLAIAGLDPAPAGDGSEWIEPPEKIIWQCAGCDAQVIISNECPYDGAQLHQDDEIWLLWEEGHGTSQGNEPEREPPYVWDDQPICGECMTECEECSTPVFVGAAEGRFVEDACDPGASFPGPAGETVCYTCLDKLSREEEDDQ